MRDTSQQQRVSYEFIQSKRRERHRYGLGQQLCGWGPKSPVSFHIDHHNLEYMFQVDEEVSWGKSIPFMDRHDANNDLVGSTVGESRQCGGQRLSMTRDKNHPITQQAGRFQSPTHSLLTNEAPWMLVLLS
jgi:hypothetical protein